MQQSVRAIVTVVPLGFTDRVEVQALLVKPDDSLTGTGLVYAPEPWHVWRTRFELPKTILDDAEFTLARSEAAQLGVVEMSLPPDLIGREFVVEPELTLGGCWLHSLVSGKAEGRCVVEEQQCRQGVDGIC